MTNTIARAMVDNRVQALGALGRTIEARSIGVEGLVAPNRIAPVVGAQWDGLATPAVAQYRILVNPEPTATGDEANLLARESQCAHLRFVSGRCPTARDELAMSPASARAMKVSVGSRVAVLQRNSSRDNVRRTLLVTGLYDQPRADDFWRGLDITKVTVKTLPRGGGQIQHYEWITAASTFSGPPPPPIVDSTAPRRSTQESPAGVGWAGVETTVGRQLRQGMLTYEKLDRARDAVSASRRDLGAIAGLDVQLTEQVSTVDGQVRGDVDQIRTIAPLLLAQLVLLQVVLVWIVLRALLTQRRSEVALLRLRSPGRPGARRLLVGEMTSPVILALPLGLLLAYALDALGRSTWLEGTAWGGWSWTAAGAALLAAGACAVLLRLMVGRLVRRPVSELLRSVPPRQNRWSLSATEAIVLTLAVGLLVTVATGTLSGAPVLVTPIVMALAVGLIVGGLLVPVGNRVTSRLLRRGRVAALLGVAGLARRPSTRNLILAMTAAGALLTFTTSTMDLGRTNRAEAADAVSGAPVRIIGDDLSGFTEARRVIDVVNRLDPGRQHLAPVVRARSGSSDGPVMLAGEPAAMSRIAYRAGQPDPWALLPRTPPAQGLATVSATWSPPFTTSSFSGPSLAAEDADYVTVGQVPVIPGGEPHLFVTSIQPMLQQASRTTSVTAEIWSDGRDPALISRAQTALRDAGFGEINIDRQSTHRKDLDRSASAYGLQLGLVVAAGSVLVAALVMIAVLSTQAGVRRRDQSALVRAGVGRSILGRARRLETVLTVVPMALGGLVGMLGARLAAPSIPWYTDDPPYPIASDQPPWSSALVALLIGLVLVTVVAAVLRREPSTGSGRRGRDA
ncbi:hypothetical protein [Luteipulveratus mongoliensis]|nr:hypothetical protein [Luteipulveratus mongoliensis]